VHSLPAAAEVSQGEGDAALPPIWVVNLDRSPDRWAQTQEELAKQGLQADRFPATDGKAMTDAELEEGATWWARHFCTPGMIGCFMSHLRIWKAVVAQGLECVIVFEDDVVPHNNFKHSIKAVLEELEALPDGWDICLLGAIGCVNPIREPLHMRFYELGPGGGRPAPKGSRTRSLSDHIFVPRRPAGTHAYMVSKSGAQKLAKQLPKARYHVDLAAWSRREINLVAARPFLATQRFDEGGASSTVANDKSRSERFLKWCWDVSGITAMGRSGGVPNPSWAWRTPLFAVPIPWRRWPRNVRPVLQGPCVSFFMLLVVASIATRNPAVAGATAGYLLVMTGFVRFLCGTWSWPMFLLEVLATIFYLRIAFLRMLPL